MDLKIYFFEAWQLLVHEARQFWVRLRRVPPIWVIIYLLSIYALWLYFVKFFGLSIDYVVEVSRSVVIGGVEANRSYYPLGETIKYLGGAILAGFILIQNEWKHILKPREWENYITTLVGIAVFGLILLWSGSSDFSPRSQIPFLVVGGSILTVALLLQNQTKSLLVLIVASVKKPREVMAMTRGSIVITAFFVIFLFILFNLPYLPTITINHHEYGISQNLAEFCSFVALAFVIIWSLLLAKENMKPDLAAHRLASLVFLLILPALLFVILRVMILVKTDPRWEITFEFMEDIGGFPINNWPNQIVATQDSRWLFYKAALINTVRATLVSIFLCTVIGIIVGITRLSSNRLASFVATCYVEIFRNIPLAILLFLVVTQLNQSLPLFRDASNFWDMEQFENNFGWRPFEGTLMYISNQGVWTIAVGFERLLISVILLLGVKIYTMYADRDGVDDSYRGIKRRMAIWAGSIALCFILVISGEINYPNYIKPNLVAPGSWRVEDGTGFEISIAFIALVTGLTLYTSTFVAEIVRGSIQSLPRGQVEAAISLGLNPYQRLRLIIMPQALRSMIPLLNNQYMNVWKNSSLAIIVAFSDIFYVAYVMMNNVGKLIPLFMLLLFTYQIGSLLISSIMNFYNYRVTKVKI